MARPFPTLESEFDEFLFATVGEEKNGMLLSVISALARLDVDPWQEAANLAQLPEKTATTRLASLIQSLPDGSALDRGPAAIASRLITLLPRSANAAVASDKTSNTMGATATWRSLLSVVMINALFLAILLGTQSLMTHHLETAQIDTPPAPVLSSPSQPMPSPKAMNEEEVK